MTRRRMTRPLSVRLSEAANEQLNQLAQELSLNRTETIMTAIDLLYQARKPISQRRVGELRRMKVQEGSS